MVAAAPAVIEVAPGGALRGRVLVPGDKSISHRAAILAALAAGTSRIHGALDSDDCRATLAALAACGIRHALRPDGVLEVEGGGWRAPTGVLDLGNSGTGLRLLAGALASRPFAATLVGDASLSRRPMERIAAPLRAMGAEVECTVGTPPLRVHGRARLRGIAWRPEVASAQVKSAILIAGLAAEGEVAVFEPVATRDHTERLLRAFGAGCTRDGEWVRLGERRALQATQIAVPGDLSSAAPFIVGAAMTPGSELVVEGVGLNPTRCGVLEALAAMGADLEVTRDPGADAFEPVGRVVVRGRELVACDIGGALAANAIDELPLLMVAAAGARGTTRLRDASELRHKESDRLAVLAAGLAALGVRVELAADGLDVHGGRLRGGAVDAAEDHRLAMAFAIAALRAERPVTVHGAATIPTSFPSFLRAARDAGLRLSVEVAA